MKYLICLLSCFTVHQMMAQVAENAKNFKTTAVSIDDLKHAAYAYEEDYILIVGGELTTKNQEISLKEPNNNLLLFDWTSDTVIGLPLEQLDVDLKDQLSARSMAFLQEGDSLFLIGGFGYSAGMGVAITFPAMLILDVPAVINCIIEGTNPAPFITQIYDERLAILNAELDKVNRHFFLAEGEHFEFDRGKYQSHYFIKKYNNEIRTFELIISADRVEILDFCVWTDIDAFFEAFEGLIPATIFDNNIYRFESYPDY